MSATETPTVVQAWAKVMADVQSVGKTGRNTQQNYDFRGIDAVLNAVGPATRKHGVLVMPSLISADYRDVEVGKNRTLMREVTVKVRFTVFGPGGDVLTVPDDPNFGVVPGESMDSGDKGTAKAMSVAQRTFLIQALLIPTGEHDPDASSYERSARAATQPEATRQVTAQDCAMVAAEAFAGAVNDAPKGSRSRVMERLRHAVVWAATEGRTHSLKECTPEDLTKVHGRLLAVKSGKATYVADPVDDAGGVTFKTSAGERTVLWAEFEDQPEPEASNGDDGDLLATGERPGYTEVVGA